MILHSDTRCTREALFHAWLCFCRTTDVVSATRDGPTVGIGFSGLFNLHSVKASVYFHTDVGSNFCVSFIVTNPPTVLFALTSWTNSSPVTSFLCLTLSAIINIISTKNCFFFSHLKSTNKSSHLVPLSTKKQNLHFPSVKPSLGEEAGN